MNTGVVANDNIDDENSEPNAVVNDLNMEWGRKTLRLIRRRKTMNHGIERMKCLPTPNLPT